MIRLQNGIDINMKDCDERTALHIACNIRSFNVVKLLLEHGPDPELRDSGGNTSFLLTLFPRRCHNMETLLVYGVDMNVKSCYRNVPPICQLLHNCLEIRRL